MIGLHLHTLHMAPMPCDSNPGIYYRGEDFAAGVFRNSECRPGAWAGWNAETNTLTLGPVATKAGVVVGGLLGYARGPRPLVLPSIATKAGSLPWLRLTWIPTIKPHVIGGVHFSVEIPYK